MIQHLIQVLKHGYGYDRTNDDGSIEHVLVAPNKYMISAAKEIETLIGHLNNVGHSLEVERARVQELESMAIQYRQTIKRLEDDAARNVSSTGSDSTREAT